MPIVPFENDDEPFNMSNSNFGQQVSMPDKTQAHCENDDAFATAGRIKYQQYTKPARLITSRSTAARILPRERQEADALWPSIRTPGITAGTDSNKQIISTIRNHESVLSTGLYILPVPEILTGSVSRP